MNTLLIVEDDADIRRSLSIRLGAGGYRVVGASNPASAMSTAEREHPDLIVLDVLLPGGDGFAVAARMRAFPTLETTPLIFLTASRRPEYRRRAEELGAVGFFEKPYEAAELIDRIDEVLGVKRGIPRQSLSSTRAPRARGRK